MIKNYNEIEKIENLASEVYGMIEVCKDSCGFNEYYSQETVLIKALENQKLIIEKLFELG